MPKRKIIDLNESFPEKKVKVSKPKAAKPKVFENAPQDHYFILCDGQVAKSIRDLADILESVDDGVFYHHVNAERNDFATWIKDIFEEQALVNALANVKDKGNTRIVIYRYLLDCANKRM